MLLPQLRAVPAGMIVFHSKITSLISSNLAQCTAVESKDGVFSGSYAGRDQVYKQAVR
jgi:hypothetical protein